MLLNFEHLKTFYSALKQKMKNFRGNWNQNDPTADDYIKNRPFYSEGAQEVTILHYTVDTDAGSAPMISAGPTIYNVPLDTEGLQPFVVDQEYSIKWNNKTYTCKAKLFEDIPSLGDTGLVQGYADTGEPFLIAIAPEGDFGAIITTEAGKYPITITMHQEVVHKLDKKFIDIPDNLVTTEMLEASGVGLYSKGLAYVLVDGGYEVSGIGTCTDLNIAIPFSVDGKRVISIGRDAFRDCSNLTSITIPDSVTSIGKYAFSGCSGLTNVIIPGSVTIINASAFSGCSGLTNIIISDGVMSIGETAFAGCNSLTSIIIPGSVTIIGWSAFQACQSLTNVIISDGVPYINTYAFNLCSALKSITIPKSVTQMGENVFNGCSNLTIYCEAESAHKFWSQNWNSGNCPVIWGAALDFAGVNDRLSNCATTEYVDNAIATATGDISWNDLTDKPFEDALETITWDGDTTGKETMSGNYKISDTYIQPDKFIGATIHFANGYTYTVVEEDITTFDDQFGTGFDIRGMVAGNETSPSNPDLVGIFVVETLRSIEFPIKTLDEKFIPDTIARMSDIQTAIGDAIGGSY